MEPEASENIFQQIQNKGSASEPLSQQYLTQERANAAIGPQTSLQNAGNVNVGGNNFNLKASPYLQTAGAQAFQEGIGAAGEAAPVAAAALIAATGVGMPVSAYMLGATGGSGLAASLAGFGTGIVAAHGVNKAYGALTGPGGLRGQQAYQRMDEPTATSVGEFAPYLAAGKPWGEGSWNGANIAAGGLAASINAVASQGVYNPQATPEENAIEIAKQTGMGMAFGAMGPTKIGESLAGIGGNIGLNNPLYRGAVKSTMFNGGEKPMFTDGAVNGVSFKEPGGTATIYDPVSGTGRVLHRNADGTVTSVNYNNLEGQAAKNSGQSTFGLKDSGPGSLDFTMSRYGTPNPPEQGPIDVQSTPVEPTGPIGRGRQLNEPQWGQQGDVGKPNGRGPVFGQDVQAPGPVSTENAPAAQTPKTPASESPASAVAPAVETPSKPAPTPASTTPITPAETKPQIPEGHAPARPTPADFGIPENPSMEWHSKPENQKLWTKYSNAVNKWDMDYAMTHRPDGRPLSQGSTEAPQTPTNSESPAVAVSGVETPTAPIPKPSAASKPTTGTATATAERPSPGEIPGPAETGQTPITTNTTETTGTQNEIPSSKPGSKPAEVVSTELPSSIPAPIISERKKDATKDEILSGVRGIDETSNGIEASLTNDERLKHFSNRAKYLTTTDPSKLTEKDIRDRARIVSSEQPSIPSTDATYTGPKLPSFVSEGVANGKTVEQIYQDSGEIAKTELAKWVRDYQIWMDSISNDNKSPSEIAASATPESIANQNHAIADAGYKPMNNAITIDIQNGGKIVAVSDFNKSTDLKHKLNHDESVYLKHPQTQKAISIRMPDGTIKHYQVRGPLFVNGLARDASGKIISDDPISMYESNISGKTVPVGVPKVLHFTPNALTEVSRINQSQLNTFHTNKIEAPTTQENPSTVSKPVVTAKPEPIAQTQTPIKVVKQEPIVAKPEPAPTVAETPTPITEQPVVEKPKTKIYKFRREPKNIAQLVLKNNGYLPDGLKLDKNKSISEYTTEQIKILKNFIKKNSFQSDLTPDELRDVIHHLVTINNALKELRYNEKDFRKEIASVYSVNERLVYYEEFTPEKIKEQLEFDKRIADDGSEFGFGPNEYERLVQKLKEKGLLNEQSEIVKPESTLTQTTETVSGKPVSELPESKPTSKSEEDFDSKIQETSKAEEEAVSPPVENTEQAWTQHNKSSESKPLPQVSPSKEAIPSAIKKGKPFKSYDVTLFVEGNKISEFSGRKAKGAKLSDFSEAHQILFKSYASDEAAIMRNGGYPAFFDNSELGGGWITAPIPMADGNFLIYETNPRGKSATGNAANRTVRLFRYVVNSSGNQLVQPYEINQNQITGFKSIDEKYSIPALSHAMLVASDDYIKSKYMSVNDVQQISGGKSALTGEIDSGLRDYEEQSLAPPGIRQMMEQFNVLPNGSVINENIIRFMSDPTNNDVAKELAYELEFSANLSVEAAKKFVRDIIDAQNGDQELINFNIIRTPDIDTNYPTAYNSKLAKQGNSLFRDYLRRARKALVTQVGRDDPATGLPYEKEIQKINPATGKPMFKNKKDANGKDMVDENGVAIVEPWMVPNPKRWLLKTHDFVTEETYHVKDELGNTKFKPMPYQIDGMNVALTRFLRDSTPVKSGEVGRAFLNMDAPGLGKTIQILGTAKAWHEKMKVWTKDPNSPWFGKPAKVLIVSQNRTILKNAFGGDAKKMGLDLGGEFIDVGGGTIKFVPKNTVGTDEGGLSVDGEESWIDFATYGDIKPQMERVPLWLDDAKTKPKMIKKYVIKEDGEILTTDEGEKVVAQEPDGKGGWKDVMEQEHAEVRNGPPKKGAGEWGLVVFDECHNMKNVDSGRSQAGYDIFIRSQHIMLATGTPIDKPQQLGYFLALVLDVPLSTIAPEIKMTVEGAKINRARIAKNFTAQDFRDTLSTKHWDKLKGNEAKADNFMLALRGIRRIRDRAGQQGRLIRRGKAFYGTPDLWFDSTDSMSSKGKEFINKHELWWAARIAEEPNPQRRRLLKGQFLMESKRLAACIKLGIPNTMFNPGNEPTGALRILLNEIKSGRKVIITVDTTNELGVIDVAEKSKFKGLQDGQGEPLGYDSELTMLKDYLTKSGIKFGTIVGADIKDRQKSIDAFQENNMDTPVIVMTIASGGTGLSLQDLFNVNRDWGYDRKTGGPKVELGEGIVGPMAGEEGRKFAFTNNAGGKLKEGVIPPLGPLVMGSRARMHLDRSSEPEWDTYDKPVPTDSHPRSMIIVSAPWGGDAVEQVIGRADRMNTTTPTRVFWITTEISSGDRRLMSLVRAKIKTLESMIKYGDDLDAAIEGGTSSDAKPSDAPAGQSKKIPLETAKQLALTALKGLIVEITSRKEYYENAIAGALKQDPELTDKKLKDKVKKWRAKLLEANQSIDSVKITIEEVSNGKLDPYSINPDKIKDLMAERGIKEIDEKPGEEGLENVDEGKPGEDDTMDNVYKNIINKNIVTNSNGVDIIVSPGKTKVSRNKMRNVINNLYLLQSNIVPEKALPEVTDKVNDIINAIVRPYRAAFANKEINARRFAAILGFAKDIAWRLQDYSINSVYASTPEEMRQIRPFGAAGAINIAARDLVTILFNQDVVKRTTGRKEELSAKSAMLTTFHEVGHALMRMIPDSMKSVMFNELESARKMWFDNLPEGDARKSLSMPEFDWHYTGGMRNYTFGHKTVTKFPIEAAGYTYSKQQKTYDAPTVSYNRKIHPKITRGKFHASSMISLALSLYAEHNEGLNNSAKATKLASTANLENSGVGGDGQLGFQPGSGALGPFLSLFSLGLGKNMSKLMTSEAPILEIWNESSPKSGFQITEIAGKKQMSISEIHSMISNGRGYISQIKVDNYDFMVGKITTVSAGKITHIIIDARTFASRMADEYLNKIKSKSDDDKLTMFEEGDILNEFIHGASGDDYLRQLDNIRNGGKEDYESRIYRLMNPDEWLAENTAAYARDYYMLGTHSPEVSMAGDIVASLYVHASSGGDGRLTRRIISSIFNNTIPYTDNALESGTQFYKKYGMDYNAPRNENQQSGSLSPPEAELNKNIKRGMSVTEEALIKSGKGATFSASSVRHIKQWSRNARELILWALGHSNKAVPSQKQIRKKLEEIKANEPDAKATGSPPIYYYLEGMLGTLIGQIEQIGRITNNDLVRELGTRLYNRANTGEIAQNTYTEDLMVYQNHWQSVFANIIKKHLGEQIAKSSENTVRLISASKAFDISNDKKDYKVKDKFRRALSNYILHNLNPEYNKYVAALEEARAYANDDKWHSIPDDLKAILESLGVSGEEKIGKLQSMINQLEINAYEEAGKYGNGSKFDKIQFGREADFYLGEFFEHGTVDKMLMDVGRAMGVSRNMPDYDKYMNSMFTKEVIAAAHELTEKWAKPYREWAESMGEEISDWGTSWRPRIIDANSVHGIRSGVRNKKDLFIRKAAETIYEDNKHQRVLLPIEFKEFFEKNLHFLEYGSPIILNSTKTPWGLNTVNVLAAEMVKEFKAGKMNEFLTKRINKIITYSQNNELKSIDGITNFGFDVDITPTLIKPKIKPAEITNETFYTTKALSIAIMLKTYREVLKRLLGKGQGRAFDGEMEMLDKAITRLEQQSNRKSVENVLKKSDAFKLARQFADRVLIKSLGIASSGSGYDDIFSGQHGDLNKADSQHERLMECEFADKLLAEFYTTDVRIFGKHYNRQVTKNIMTKHHIPESFWNALRTSVISNPESTHFWPDICFAVRRITENDQQEGPTVLGSVGILAAHSLYMTKTSTLQFAEPLIFGVSFNHPGPVESIIESSKAMGGNLRSVFVSMMNSVASVAAQFATAGKVDVESIPGTKNYQKEDEFYIRLANRIGIIQNRYLEGLDTSTADTRFAIQKAAERALERFHSSGSGLTAVTDASRTAVLKATIISLEQMADDIITRTRAANENGEWIRGEELKQLTNGQIMQFRNMGIFDSDIPSFLEFASTYRASISGDYSTMSPEMMDDLIDKKTQMQERFLADGKRSPTDRMLDNRVAASYFRALARMNFMTVQVSSRAVEQRTRAWIQKHTSAGFARNLFFLSLYGSAVSRNVLLPAARVFNAALKNKNKQFGVSPGSHDPAHRTGRLPTDAYISNISNPYAGFSNAKTALSSIIAVSALMMAVNYNIRKGRMAVSKNPSIYITDEPSDAVKILASADSAGFFGNASLPINVISGGIRFKRSSAQIAIGPYPGKITELLDATRNTYGPNNRNSPNTPTSERELAGLIYDVAAIPLATATMSYLLPQTNVGDMLFFSGVQSMSHPGVKEAFKQAFPGSGEAVPRSKADINRMYKQGLIGYSDYVKAIQEREDYEIRHPFNKDAFGETERR